MFNGNLMNDAIFKFKRYEDSSLSYTGIDKNADKDVGGWDIVIKREEYEKLFFNQQATMEASSIFEVPQGEDIPMPEKKPASTTQTHSTTVETHTKSNAPSLVTAQYGVKPVTSATSQNEKPVEFVVPDVMDGSIVIHKSFGEGTVARLDKVKKYLRVKFAVGEKTSYSRMLSKWAS